MTNNFILSVELGVLADRTELSYNIPAIFENVDLVNLKSYNLRGAAADKTFVHSALYSYLYGVNDCLTGLTKYGIDKEKIILGVPTVKIINDSFHSFR